MSLDTVEGLAAALQSQHGISRATAEHFARKALNRHAREDAATVERDARVLEKAEQAEIIKLFREHGFTVRSTSQARPSKIAIGFPDLFVTHATQPIGFFFETKRQVGSVMSDAQKDFANDCWRVGIKCYSGDRYAAQRVLDDHGLTRTP